MLTIDVLKQYHKTVPFPWTTAKIKRAGLNPTDFLIGLGKNLQAAEDAEDPKVREVLKMLKELEILG